MARRDGSRRFSLLLLEDGDQYVRDWVTTCHELDGQAGRNVRGRLRLCVRSLFFEPWEAQLPIFMFPLRPATAVESDARAQRLLLATDAVIKMRANGEDSPYDFLRCDAREGLSRWAFSLDYARLDELLAELMPLLAIVGLPFDQRDPGVERIAAAMESSAQFDVSRIVDLSENILLNCAAAQVTPLVREPGRLVLTQKRLYFQPLHNIGNESPIRCFSMRSLKAVARRRQCLRQRGLEVFFSAAPEGGAASLGGGCAPQGTLGDPFSAFFTFGSQEERDTAAQKLLELAGGPGSIASATSVLLEADKEFLHHMTEAWKVGSVSNYEYLVFLNLAAGRSFNDLAQWPIMPWILADYSSPVLDLSDPNTFRDLSKPVGALSPARLQDFRTRYQHMLRDEELTGQKAFLYGTHYSTPGYVLYWLVRVAPAHMLRLQNGRFDAPDRLFNGMKESWDSVLSNASDVKELIPEFFAPPSSFLILPEDLHLGIRQSGLPVGNVELPPWAADADDFIRQHAAALESEWVSAHLHDWIDLIFGHKQQGEAAEAADNVFHALTYEGSVDLDKVDNPVQRKGYEAQINEFGQTPRQLFTIPHPRREHTAHQRGQHSGFNLVASAEAVHRSSQHEAAGTRPAGPSALEASSSITNRLLSHVMTVLEPVVRRRREEHSDDPGGRGSPGHMPEGGAGQQGGGTTPGAGSTQQPAHGAVAARGREKEHAGAKPRAEAHQVQGPGQGSRGRGAGVKEIQGGLPKSAGKPGFDTRSTALRPGPPAEDSRGLHLWMLGLRALPHLGTSAASDSIGHSGVQKREVRTHRTSIAGVALESSPSSAALANLIASLAPPGDWHDKSGPSKKGGRTEEMLLYSASTDGVVKVSALHSQVQIRSATMCPVPVSCFAVAHAAQPADCTYPLVLAGGLDDCIWAYSMDYCRVLGKISAHDDTLTCLRAGAQGGPLQGWLFSASLDCTVKCWALQDAPWAHPAHAGFCGTEPLQPEQGGGMPTDAVAQLYEHDSAVWSVCLGPPGTPVQSVVLSGAENGLAVAWDVRAPETSVAWSNTVAAGVITGLQCSSDGRFLVVAGTDGTLRCLEMRMAGTGSSAGKELASRKCGAGRLLCVEVGGYVAAAGSEDGRLCVWPWEQSVPSLASSKATLGKYGSGEQSGFFTVALGQSPITGVAVEKRAWALAAGGEDGGVAVVL